MNGTEPKIEVFKPFGEAFDLMKRILFQPFDLKKWLVIGFAAFLSGHLGGGGFSFPSRWGQFHPARNQSLNPPNFEQWKPWLPIIIPGLVVAILGLVLLFTWLKARANFIFTDCIVRNRGAIVEPWREYRSEGNSYFAFLVALMLASIIAFALIAFLLVAFGLFNHKHGTMPISLLVFLFSFGSGWRFL